MQRKRKSWTFERLEDRLVFSVAPYSQYVYAPQFTSQQAISYSNDNPEGAALTLADELNWAQLAAASASGQSTDASTAQNAATSTDIKYVTQSLPNDPYFPNPANPTAPYTQWHLLNLGQEVGQPDLQHLFGVAGQDLNVLPAWNMVDANGNPITGKGVKVAVIDTGVQLFHPDLAANISPTLRFNSENGTNNVSPDLLSLEGFHGTAVAGIIGAVANNGIGGTGVAPGVTIVPIRADQSNPFGRNGFTDQSLEDALLYAIQHNIDITNNSLGPDGLTVAPLDATFLQILRDSVVYGRNGLGMINVYASGNDAGPGFGQFVGSYASASYNPLVNSRYTIGVGGVDHDGLYVNADGTFTYYPEAGPSVLVAAPTGSTGATDIGDDDGFGSGIITTDLTGDFGLNAAPLPSGYDPDRDFLQNPDYTSRMNGTSASTPMVSGVIALMLQANPSLTFRDVEEILVRSSRQNAQFEFPTSGGIGSSQFGIKNTWQTNQTGPFRNPDSFFNPLFDFFDFDVNPIADPSTEPTFEILNDPFGGTSAFQEFAPPTNDDNRQFSSIYEPEPALFTNGAGYTVSQGYGVYGEQIGYAHGVVDAGAAVYMALHWDELKQNIAPNTELTYTTSIVAPVGKVLAAEKGAAPPNGDEILVPGGLSGTNAKPGYIAYWNQYFANPPFANYTGPPAEGRGISYIDFAVPPSQEMNIEWAEVKLSLNGPDDAFDGLRIMLVSPDGTQSELTNFYPSGGFLPATVQPSSKAAGPWFINPGRQYARDNQGNFTFTFSTNRSWGENSSSEVLIHPVTGEPVMQEVDTFDFNDPFNQTTTDKPIFRNWELHFENWSATPINVNNVEVIWHGKPIGGGKYDPNYNDNGIISAQRVQGVVGIDTNGDNQFNFGRYVQTLNGQHADVSDIRDLDVKRQLDFNDNNHNDIYDEGDTINQEPFAANIVVDAYKVWGGIPEATPTARFLTGADGNYYFDLDPVGDLAQTKTVGNAHFGQTIEYQIRASDPLNRQLLQDIVTPALTTTDPGFTYLPHYQQTWTINPNWFFAADHDNPLLLGNNPGEVFYDATGANVDLTITATHEDPVTHMQVRDLPEPGLPSPLPWTNFGTLDHIIPAPVKNLNFLIKQAAPANQFDVQGTVYSDVNGDGKFNGSDAAAAGVFVYWDVNRNGVHDSSEPEVLTGADGHYTITLDLNTLNPVPTGNSTYQLGVIKPSDQWKFTDPGQDGVEDVFAGAGSPAQLVNFFIQPPSATPPGGSGPGTIQGLVFNDLNGNGIEDLTESGVPGFTVFIDSNLNGVFDSATERSTITGPNGGYFFANVDPGVYRIDVVIPNEGTPSAAWSITSPSVGYRDVQLGPGGSVQAANFGLDNLADSDWGDLPDSFNTLAGSNGPSNTVVAGFQLGNLVTGDVNGQPGPLADADVGDDGIQIISNGGILKTGVNTIRVTVFGVGGLLTGWMDFNNDGHFDESERLLWTGGDATKFNTNAPEADLNPGTYDMQVTIPASAVINRPIAARFRWGQVGLTFTGHGEIGETEDYVFGLNYIFGDYNRNGTVDLADYVVWRNTKGQTVSPPFSGADGNGDGVVNDADYDVWRAHLGQSVPGPGAGAILAEASASSNTNSGSTVGSGLTYSYSTDVASGSNSTPQYSVLSFGHPANTQVAQSSATPPSSAPSANAGAGTSAASTGSTLTSADFAILVGAGQTGSTSSAEGAVAQSPTSNTESSSSDLLLLDQAWSDMSSDSLTSFDHADESLYTDGTSHESLNDLALAAVMNDDDQWNSI